jgi:hypothetical protein
LVTVFLSREALIEGEVERERGAGKVSGSGADEESIGVRRMRSALVPGSEGEGDTELLLFYNALESASFFDQGFLSPDARERLRSAIFGWFRKDQRYVEVTDEEETTTSSAATTTLTQDAEEAAVGRFGSALRHLAGLGDSASAEAQASLVHSLATAAGLLVPSDEDESLSLTAAGFDVLLGSAHEQVWSLLLGYAFAAAQAAEEEAGGSSSKTLSALEERRRRARRGAFVERLSQLRDGAALTELDRVLRLATELAASPVARWRPLADWQSDDLPHLEALAALGFLVLRDDAWAPTRVSYALARPALRSLSTTGSPDYLVVETNFRIYAYTSSPVMIAVLSMFSRPLTRLPNMVVTLLSRESVRTALAAGISGRQMVAFLHKFAHPEAKGGLPVAVEEQVLLWEAERERVKTAAAQLLRNFGSRQAFDGAVEAAQKAGVHLFSSWETQTLVVTADAESLMQRHLGGVGMAERGPRSIRPADAAAAAAAAAFGQSQGGKRKRTRDELAQVSDSSSED